VLNVFGKPEDAVRAAQKAMRLDPTGKDFYSYDVGVAYVEMGRYKDAIPVLKQHLTVHPNTLMAHVGLIVAYTELGRGDDARAEAAQIMRMSPQFTVAPLLRAKDEAWDKRVGDDLRKAGLK
jgi:predicted Zn-dependent protease